MPPRRRRAQRPSSQDPSRRMTSYPTSPTSTQSKVPHSMAPTFLGQRHNGWNVHRSWCCGSAYYAMPHYGRWHDVRNWSPSGLTFCAGSATNPHGHNRPTGFIRDFNLLVEAASVSASSGLTQDISGAFQCFEANSFKIRKLLTLPIVFEERIAISHVEKIQCHRSFPGKASSRTAQ